MSLLGQRYASQEMKTIWSREFKIKSERDLWITVLKTQKKLGLEVSDEVISQYETENPITGKTEIERRIIATGKVTNLIDPKSSWIIIDNKDQESKIRLGDIIKMKYSKNKFKSFVKVANKALN